MSPYGIRNLTRRFCLLLSSFRQAGNLLFFEVLTQEQIEAVCEKHGVEIAPDDEDVIFTPPVVIWGFLSQVIHKEEMRSCLAAVARIGVMLVALGRPACAQNSGPYCRARCRLPVAIFEELTRDVAARCQALVPADWLWLERHVRLIDATTVTMPDTEANQMAFPQQSCQKEGLGFPIARLLVVLSLATAMLEEMAMAPYSGKETGELSLLRQLLDRFDWGDIALCDKLYCSYFMLVMLLQRGTDVVTLLHQSRKVETQRGERLGKHDHLVTWNRPARPEWMPVELYEQMPETLRVRWIHVSVAEPGFRTQSLDIVTTLTDAERYGVDEVAKLYHRRWLVELDIRTIKSTMGMDALRCQTPDMVRKEIWTCLLAYNLVRHKILQSAMENGVSPRDLSFANALQVVAAGWMVMPLLDEATGQCLAESQLEGISGQTIGDRPGRVEPRAVKKRPKPYRLLTMPREEARELILQGNDPYKKQR